MKKIKKPGKVWIVVVLVAAFLVAGIVLVYADGRGFACHTRSSSDCNKCGGNYCSELTSGEWDLIMRKIDGLNFIKTN